MNRKALCLFGVFLVLPSTFASDLEEPLMEDDIDPFNDYAEPRFLTSTLNFSQNGAFVTFNKSLLLFTGGIVLWGIAGAMLLYYLLTVPAAGLSLDYAYDGGYGGIGAGSDLLGYSTRSDKRAFNPYGAVDWEKFSILDWVAMAEETWRKFEPYNLDCQKRVICELHQNAVRFGQIARKLVDVFSYLEYAKVLRLPDEVMAMIEEYLDAADKGRSVTKDCGDIFPSCKFSVKKVVDRVSENEI